MQSLCKKIFSLAVGFGMVASLSSLAKADPLFSTDKALYGASSVQDNYQIETEILLEPRASFAGTVISSGIFSAIILNNDADGHGTGIWSSVNCTLGNTAATNRKLSCLVPKSRMDQTDTLHIAFRSGRNNANFGAMYNDILTQSPQFSKQEIDLKTSDNSLVLDSFGSLTRNNLLTNITVRVNFADTDGDTIADIWDNCPEIANQDQAALDGHETGVACEDDDGDGSLNGLDVCPTLANPDQLDGDQDHLGDLCDDDLDGDGLANEGDSCPNIANPDQKDENGNNIGDACEEGAGTAASTGDQDQDTIADAQDNCPVNVNPQQEDRDEDGFGDSCDQCADLKAFPGADRTMTCDLQRSGCPCTNGPKYFQQSPTPINLAKGEGCSLSPNTPKSWSSIITNLFLAVGLGALRKRIKTGD